MFFLIFHVEFQLYFTEFLKVYVTVLLLKEYLTSKIDKSVPIVCCFFCRFMKPLIPLELFPPMNSFSLGKKTFTTWNVLTSEVYLTCINFWIFHPNHLKPCLEVIRLPSWPKILKFNVKTPFLRFWLPEKLVLTNFKFNFSESGPRSVLILPKPVFLFKFSNI